MKQGYFWFKKSEVTPPQPKIGQYQFPFTTDISSDWNRTACCGTVRFFVPQNYRTASLLRYGFVQISEPSIFGGIFTEFGQMKAVLAVFLPYLAKFKGFLTNNRNNR